MPGIPLAVLTVLNSQAVGGPDGRAAVVVETKEVGPVAFEVDLQAIEALRKNLLAAERTLRQQTGKCSDVVDGRVEARPPVGEALSRMRRFADGRRQGP